MSDLNIILNSFKMFLLVSLSEVVYFYLRKLAIDILKTHYKKLYKTILHKEFKNGLILLAHFVNVFCFLTI